MVLPPDFYYQVPEPTPTFLSTAVPTVTATPTPTSTLTPTPTPVLMVVQAGDAGGAFYRDEPDGQVVGLLANGTVVQVISGPVEAGGKAWLQVLTPDNVQAWMLAELLQPQGTPAP